MFLLFSGRKLFSRPNTLIACIDVLLEFSPLFTNDLSNIAYASLNTLRGLSHDKSLNISALFGEECEEGTNTALLLELEVIR